MTTCGQTLSIGQIVNRHGFTLRCRVTEQRSGDLVKVRVVNADGTDSVSQPWTNWMHVRNFCAA